MSEAHHPLGASGAARRNACTASVGLQQAFPETEESEASREGTATHWASVEVWQGRPVVVGSVAPNGVVVDEEMIEAVELYVGHLRSIVDVFPIDQAHLEETLPNERIYPGVFTTPDFWLFRPAVLYIRELKYGHGYVEVFENAQLIDQAAAIIDALGIDGHAEQFLEVDFGIVQPRSFHRDGPIRTWRCRMTDLRGHINYSSGQAHEAMGPEAKYRAGGHCDHCSGRHVCPVAQRESYRAADLARVSTPIELPPEAIGLELQTLEQAQAILEARISGLKGQAIALERQNIDVPFYRMEQGEGRERWVPEKAAEVLAICDLLGHDVRKKDALVTPKQARRLGVDASVISAYSETPRGEWKLVPDTTTKAAKVFKP